MSPIRIGFVGLSKEGWAALSLAPPLLQHPLVEKYSLTALSTTSEASASESAKKHSQLAGHEVKAYYGDTSQISQDPNVDLVAVAVKSLAHKQAVLPVIAAGKDVFVEWPAGNGLKEVSELAQAARERGVRSLVGLQGRLSPPIQKVKELVASGKIGKVLSTTVIGLSPRELRFWGPWINERNAHTTDPDAGATVLHIAGGHFLDSFTYILGDFACVSATTVTQYPTASLFDSSLKPTGKTIPVSAADHFAFSGILKSGAIVSVAWRGGHASSPGRRQLRWEIDGEDGTITLENDAIGGASVQIRDPNVYLNGELVEIEGDGVPNNSTRAWLEFAKGSDGAKYATFDDAVRIHTLLNAIAESAREGKRINLTSRILVTKPSLFT